MSLADNDADEITQTDLTVQIPLRFVEPLNVVGIIKTEGESDEPLFRLAITRFTRLDSTSIGVRGSHALCAFSRPSVPLVVLTTGSQLMDPASCCSLDYFLSCTKDSDRSILRPTTNQKRSNSRVHQRPPSQSSPATTHQPHLRGNGLRGKRWNLSHSS